MVSHNHGVLFVQVVIVVIEGDLGGLASLKINLGTLRLILLLIQAAKWVDVPWARYAGEVSFASPCELQLVLDFLNHHLFKGKNVSLLHLLVLTPLLC